MYWGYQERWLSISSIKYFASFKRGNLNLHHPCKKVSVTIDVMQGAWQKQNPGTYWLSSQTKLMNSKFSVSKIRISSWGRHLTSIFDLQMHSSWHTHTHTHTLTFTHKVINECFEIVRGSYSYLVLDEAFSTAHKSYCILNMMLSGLTPVGVAAHLNSKSREHWALQMQRMLEEVSF